MFDLLRGANALIILVTIGVSVLCFRDQRAMVALLFEPFVIKSRGEWYRFITHAFVHSGWYHLAVNMFVLYMFGSQVENVFGVLTSGRGTLPYVLLYFGGIIFSSLIGYKRYQRDPGYRAVGASGAVSAVLFSYILMFPMHSIYLMFIPIPIPAVLFGAVYLFYEWYMDKRGGDNVAHDAHFFGAVFGVLFTVFLDPDLLLHIGYLESAMP